jgi:hypothetical protein
LKLDPPPAHDAVPLAIRPSSDNGGPKASFWKVEVDGEARQSHSGIDRSLEAMGDPVEPFESIGVIEKA